MNERDFVNHLRMMVLNGSMDFEQLDQQLQGRYEVMDPEQRRELTDAVTAQLATAERIAENLALFSSIDAKDTLKAVGAVQ